MHKCGLDYVVASVKVTSRDSVSQQPGYFTRGTGLPTKLTVMGIPDKCVNIEKAYIWFSYSLPLKKAPQPFNVQIRNPQNKEIYRPSTIAGRGTNGEGTGWNDDSKIHHRLDVTDIISGNGEYTINMNADSYYLDGVSLMIIYSNMNAPYQGHIVINDGFVFRVDKIGEPSQLRHDIIGLNVCESTYHTRAFALFSDLQTNQTINAVFNFNFNFITALRKFWNFETSSNFPLAKGQNKFVFGIEPELEKSSDQYTWLMAGLYYRTNNCFSCESNVDIQIQQSTNSICPGEEVVLTANIPANYKESEAKYLWSSDPVGFTSNQKTIKVYPSTKTKYTVDVILGDNCLRGKQTATIELMEPPVADAGEDIKLCGNGQLKIGKPASKGTPPYKYEWSPAEGLSNVNAESPICSAKRDITYFLKVIDSKGCFSYDTVNVKRYDLEAPKIQVIGSVAICKCSSTEITVIGDYDNYKWNTGETTKTIKVDKAGEYYVTVMDKSGCFNSSEPIQIKNIAAQTVVSLNEELIQAKLGEDITIPLKIKSSQNLNECGLHNYEATISFNRSVLVPINNTPLGQIIEPNRHINLKGRRNPNDTLLLNMQFKAVLGNSDFTKVKLESFKWTECESDISTLDSAVKIIDICEAGGLRLFDSKAVVTNLKQNYPNPFDKSTKIEFSTSQASKAQLIIANLLGETIASFDYDCQANIQYELNLDAVNLPSGVYCCRLIINGKEYNRIMRKIGA